MGIFDFLKTSGKYVTKNAFKSNLEKQMAMTPKTLNQLREIGVTADKQLKLEYFFYTDSIEKATGLAKELKDLNYTVEYGVSAADRKLFIITGWSTKMAMQEDVVINWTKMLCEIGYHHDCDFDGWGTTPDQE